MYDSRGYLSESVTENVRPMKDQVNRADWQQLRQRMVGTWAKDSVKNCKMLRDFIGPLNQAEEEKLNIVMNYLTGTGFRTGRIKHKEIQKLRDDISKEKKIRKNKMVTEDLHRKIDGILSDKLHAIIEGNDFKLMEAEEQERALLEQFVLENNLSVTSMQLNPSEADKVGAGEEVLIIRFQRDQDRYEANREYNVQDIGGEDLGFRVLTTKVFQATIDELEKYGSSKDVIERMYEKGSFPDDQVDLIRIKLAQ